MVTRPLCMAEFEQLMGAVCWQRIDMGANRFVGNLAFLLSMPYLVEIHLDGNMHTGHIPPVLSGPLQVSLNPISYPQGFAMDPKP